MASTKGKTTKSVEKKQTTKKTRASSKNENWKHVFAGFLLGLTTSALLFGVYLIVYSI